MPPIRILVVDDSVVVRRILSDTLSKDPELEVVGLASDGRIALSKIPVLRPNLVTLDVEMPVMDGLETLVELRKSHPKLPVIMFSSLTENGAAATLEALALGASDYATKPSNAGNPMVAIERIQTELVPKIKALCRLAPVQRVLARQSVRPVAQPQSRRAHPFEVVAIGASTGGRMR